MFERYTEKARRTIFFARYEASQYGSSTIASEHILLGLLREDRATMRQFAGPIQLGPEIRSEIERLIKRGKPFATSVEVPLSDESKRILNFAGEEADRFSHRHIGTEHILLGILRLPSASSGLTCRQAALSQRCQSRRDSPANRKRLRFGYKGLRFGCRKYPASQGCTSHPG